MIATSRLTDRSPTALRGGASFCVVGPHPMGHVWLPPSGIEPFFLRILGKVSLWPNCVFEAVTKPRRTPSEPREKREKPPVSGMRRMPKGTDAMGQDFTCGDIRFWDIRHGCDMRLEAVRSRLRRACGCGWGKGGLPPFHGSETVTLAATWLCGWSIWYGQWTAYRFNG